jgi:hypothetical protein
MIDFYTVLSSLADENTNEEPMKLQSLADWIIIWADASANVRKNGSIVLDPKTANVVENPKLKIKERAEKAMFGPALREVTRRATAQLVADAIEAEVINGIGEQFDVE